jgi:hypothetical protein
MGVVQHGGRDRFQRRCRDRRSRRFRNNHHGDLSERHRLIYNRRDCRLSVVRSAGDVPSQSRHPAGVCQFRHPRHAHRSAGFSPSMSVSRPRAEKERTPFRRSHVLVV